MMIPEYHNLNMDRNHESTMADILFKSNSYFHSPHSERELKPKILMQSNNVT